MDRGTAGWPDRKTDLTDADRCVCIRVFNCPRLGLPFSGEVAASASELLRTAHGTHGTSQQFDAELKYDMTDGIIEHRDCFSSDPSIQETPFLQAASVAPRRV